MPMTIPAAERWLRWIAERQLNAFTASGPTACAPLAGQPDGSVTLDVAHAGGGAQAAQRRGGTALRQPYQGEAELAIQRADLGAGGQGARRRRGGTGRQRHDERQQQCGEIHRAPASCRAPTSAREARPRCERASFSSGSSSATVRSSPSGTNNGS